MSLRWYLTGGDHGCLALCVYTKSSRPAFLAPLCRDVVLEKHYKGITSRSSVEIFWEQVAKTAKRDDVPPIITTSKYYMVNIYRSGMYVLATVTSEVRAIEA